MTQIIDLGKSIPSSFSQSTSLSVLALPSSIILGQFGLNVATGGSVQLEATIGLQSTGSNSPDVIFTLVRNAVQISTFRSSGTAVNAFDAVKLSYVDSGLTSGYYAYAITASSVSGGNIPNVVGPIVFMGLSIL
ncbi:hypothetical protein A3844_16070 [Paenibacillus helianthi]|uniref:Exosporium leader peptide n=1 Tax=Paenibacillus helianthi TaxID=1349432 RepID=A0ABX3ELL7_9BACL|nr:MULTISPECIES: hypothetical protein [Paenibacillus]OKP85448.1 hypothetical protein A3844_16070 [Paenibacillus helianthi]OKP88258.1 hypothetical protein A3848_18195 [Paenibacillus sp. P32E]